MMYHPLLPAVQTTRDLGGKKNNPQRQNLTETKQNVFITLSLPELKVMVFLEIRMHLFLDLK